MRETLIYVLQFFMIYGLIYFVYLFITIKRRKKYDSNKVSQEVTYLITKYNLDMAKINYKKFMRIILSYNSFVMTIALMATGFFDKFIFKILVAFMLILPLVLFGYNMIGSYFKRMENK